MFDYENAVAILFYNYINKRWIIQLRVFLIHYIKCNYPMHAWAAGVECLVCL